MNRRITWIIIILIIAGVILAVNLTRQKNPLTPIDPTVLNNDAAQSVAQKTVAQPLDNASERVTKKPFGIYITPKNSPVQPEKFTGFHTGTDFETFPNEADVYVNVYAICSGKILQKETARGYGGMLVESCTINNEPVTVVYGHVSLKSIAKNVGDSFSQGEKIGFLGQPPTETDGERKHLHLGIHKGTTVNTSGYIQKQSDLSAWLDFQKIQ